MKPCTLCPRECNIDRETCTGVCGMYAAPKVARAALHLWEEPCISGTRGSGTVFFSGCTLRCVYCQNAPISHDGAGQVISVQALADIFRRLEGEGAHNINLVTGTQFTPAILDALTLYKPNIPIVWNCGGYETLDTLRLLEGAVDIYLPDMKHVSPRLSALCAGAPDYFERASAAIAEMCRQTGAPVYDGDGVMLRGTLVRHLVLPGCTGDSLRVLNWVVDSLPPSTPVSLMRQYMPMPQCTVAVLNRRVTDAEYERVLAHADALQLPGYRQQKDAAEATYIPAFDGTGVKM